MNKEKILEYWSNGTPKSERIKESLLEKGLNIKHILTGDNTPTLINGSYITRGLGNIIFLYQLQNISNS